MSHIFRVESFRESFERGRRGRGAASYFKEEKKQPRGVEAAGLKDSSVTQSVSQSVAADPEASKPHNGGCLSKPRTSANSFSTSCKQEESQLAVVDAQVPNFRGKSVLGE